VVLVGGQGESSKRRVVHIVGRVIINRVNKIKLKEVAGDGVSWWWWWCRNFHRQQRNNHHISPDDH
jgi:hypothetical protein